ncbi:hypothetical protein [Bradyrhizobium sp.]|uniref:hypothetical protein n=1 Tax=Bradyrhizobium sp. TaxID=376 RepID=UPI003C45BEB8
MTNANLVRAGADDRRFPGLSTCQLSAVERQQLAEGLRHYQTFTDDRFPGDVACQRLLARIAADRLLPQAAPGLGRVIERARTDQVDCIYVTDLPTEKSIAGLLALTLGSALGWVFNYASRTGDELVMEVCSDRSGVAIDRAKLDWHTEGGFVSRDRRAEWICLFGLDNSPGTSMAYAPIAAVEQTLSARSRAWLHGRSACFHMPRDAAPSANDARAVLSRSPLGQIEIVWPSYAVHPATPGDAIGVGALSELSAEINRQYFRVSLDPGCLLAFNNCRGVHMHSPADTDGYHRFYKSYARHSLRALQQATGQTGPIFSLAGASAGTEFAGRPRPSQGAGEPQQPAVA